MKVTSITSWLTLVANFGVLGGLVFLGVEIQQNTTAIELSTAQSFQSDFRTHELVIAQDGELADLLQRGNEDISGLTQTELMRVRLLESSVRRAWANAYYHYSEGALEERLWFGQIRRMKQTWRRTSTMRYFWEDLKTTFEPDFVAFMETIVASE